MLIIIIIVIIIISISYYCQSMFIRENSVSSTCWHPQAFSTHSYMAARSLYSRPE